VRGDTIFTSLATGTDVRRVAVQTAGTPDLHSLAWSPDGGRIAFVNGNSQWRTSGNVWGSSIWIVNAEGGAPRPVLGDEHLNVSPTWIDSRHMLFVSNRDGPRGVYVVEVGPKGRRGEPRIVAGVADPHSISYSISARKLAYAKFTLRQNVWAYPLGRATAISIKDGRPVTSGSQVIEVSDVSPDGRWLAFDSNRRGNMDLYKMPLGGGDAVPLTALPGNEENPRWSPDGREIAFYASAPGSANNSQIMVMSAEGRPPSALTGSPRWNNYPAWSPSGLAIAFMSNRTGVTRIWLVSRDSVGGAWHEPVQLTDFACLTPAWVPDGSGVLCYDGRDLVSVSTQGRAVWRRNITSTLLLRFNGPFQCTRDGRTIYVSATHEDGRRGVWAIQVAGGTPRLVVVFDDLSLANAFGSFSIGPDQLYLTVSQYESDIWVATLKY